MWAGSVHSQDAELSVVMATQAYGVLSLLVPELATVGCQPAGFVSGIPGGTSHMPEHEQDLFKKKKKEFCSGKAGTCAVGLSLWVWYLKCLCGLHVRGALV